MASAIILILIFFLPVLVIPFGPSYFEIPKVIFAQILIQALFIHTLFTKPNYLLKLNLSQILVVLFTVIISIYTLLFTNQNINLFGNAFRLQGIVLFWHLILFWLLIKNFEFNIPTWIKLASIFFLLASLFLFGANGANRVVGSLGEPNSLIGTILFLWPFVWYIKDKNKYLKIVKIFLLPAILWAIYMTSSRSGFLGFLLQIVFLLLIKKLNTKIATIISILLFLSFLVLPFFDPRSGIIDSRIEIWKTAFQAGLNNPILGYGIGSIQKILNETSWELLNNVRFQTVDSTHNIFLDWFVQAGILGLFLFVWLNLKTVYNLVKKEDHLELVQFLGIITIASFNPISITLLIYFWWILRNSESDK